MWFAGTIAAIISTLAWVKREPKHLQQVDYIRAIASCGVALYHLGGKTLPLLQYGWLGVQMFFVLSGFIICWAMPVGYRLNMAGAFLLRRLVRIHPAYIVSLVLAVLAHGYFTANYQVPWPSFFIHLTYTNSFFNEPYLSPVYWTLGIEFQFYILIGLCFPLLFKKWGGLLLAAGCIIPLLTAVPGGNLADMFPFFVLGIICWLYTSKSKSLPWLLILAIIIMTITVYRFGWLQFAAAGLTMGLLLCSFKVRPVIAFLARISFSLYLTHDVIGANLVVILGNVLPKTPIGKATDFLIGILVSLLFAWVFYLLVEAPCVRWSKSIKFGRPRTASFKQ